MYTKVFEVVRDTETPLTKEEVAKKAGLPTAKATLNLLRLKEEGKIESKESERGVVWYLKEEKAHEKEHRTSGRG